MRWLAAMALAAFALAPVRASGQCAEGRVSGADTAGRCCWPGQVWSPADARCDGPPSCPAGRVAQGDECPVASGATGEGEPIPPPPQIAYAVAAPPMFAWPTAPGGRPDGVLSPRVVRGIDVGFVIAGAVGLGLGVPGAIGFGVAWASETPTSSSTASFTSSFQFPFSVALDLAVVGLALLLYAVAGYTEAFVTEPDGQGEALVSMELGAPGTEVGGTVELRF